MSIINVPPVLASEPDARADIPPERVIVAAVIEWRGRIALFKRSQRLGHDSGLWHCISNELMPTRPLITLDFDPVSSDDSGFTTTMLTDSM
jgi:hypothetical protein